MTKLIKRVKEQALKHRNDVMQISAESIIELIERLEVSELALTNWVDTALLNQRNAEYYRRLVVEIGDNFGDEAKIADDGEVHESVLCAKVPELVKKYLYSTKGFHI